MFPTNIYLLTHLFFWHMGAEQSCCVFPNKAEWNTVDNCISEIEYKTNDISIVLKPGTKIVRAKEVFTQKYIRVLPETKSLSNLYDLQKNKVSPHFTHFVHERMCVERTPFEGWINASTVMLVGNDHESKEAEEEEDWTHYLQEKETRRFYENLFQLMHAFHVARAFKLYPASLKPIEANQHHVSVVRKRCEPATHAYFFDEKLYVLRCLDNVRITLLDWVKLKTQSRLLDAHHKHYLQSVVLCPSTNEREREFLLQFFPTLFSSQNEDEDDDFPTAADIMVKCGSALAEHAHHPFEETSELFCVPRISKNNANNNTHTSSKVLFEQLHATLLNKSRLANPLRLPRNGVGRKRPKPSPWRRRKRSSCSNLKNSKKRQKKEEENEQNHHDAEEENELKQMFDRCMWEPFEFNHQSFKVWGGAVEFTMYNGCLTGECHCPNIDDYHLCSLYTMSGKNIDENSDCNCAKESQYCAKVVHCTLAERKRLFEKAHTHLGCVNIESVHRDASNDSCLRLSVSYYDRHNHIADESKREGSHDTNKRKTSYVDAINRSESLSGNDCLKLVDMFNVVFGVSESFLVDVAKVCSPMSSTLTYKLSLARAAVGQRPWYHSHGWLPCPQLSVCHEACFEGNERAAEFKAMLQTLASDKVVSQYRRGWMNTTFDFYNETLLEQIYLNSNYSKEHHASLNLVEKAREYRAAKKTVRAIVTENLLIINKQQEYNPLAMQAKAILYFVCVVATASSPFFECIVTPANGLKFY